ncbi:MAG: DNA methyltransferase [Gammaproteobacteria bacterium]|nr:DNA methyltransferase [Gammaproteobacteria bacterium]
MTGQAGLFGAPCYLAHSDCMNWLPQLPANHFDWCVTDPTYEIGILGNDWDKTGIAHRPDVWREVLRVLKPGARLIAFAAGRRYHRMACAIEDAGFQIDDLYVWLKGGANTMKGGWCAPAIDKHLGREREVIGERTLSGTAALSIQERGGTHSVGVDARGAKKVIPVTASASDEAKHWEGWAWQTRGYHEPICFARKPPEKSAVHSLVKYGCGALNVTACAVPRGPTTTSLPPNIALDAEAAADVSTQSGTTKCGANKASTSSDGAFHGGGKRVNWSVEQVNKGDFGTAERYFPKFNYVRKANKTEKVLDDGTLAPKSLASIKPDPLMRWLVQLVGRPGHRGLDIFAGSGSTLVAASALGIESYGIELHPDHYAFAMRRSGAETWGIE